jgi:folate-binding Fe-S cluster repair protein YgfZ
MQYLGKLKRRLYRLTLEGSDVPEPGVELFSPVHASSAGNVVIAARAGGHVEVLAVLQADAVEDGNIRLGAADGLALQLTELPYTLDAKLETQR